MSGFRSSPWTVISTEPTGTKDEHEALPDEQKGAVDHFRKGESGRETLISEDAYFNEIEADRQGSIKYYRKEIPRLAEIEVWTTGDNVNLGAADRGGALTVETVAGPKEVGGNVTDGDYTTAYNGQLFGGGTCTKGDCVDVFFEDMGALFWLDTMHFINDGLTCLDQFSVEISDGTRAPDGTIKWSRISAPKTRAGIPLPMPERGKYLSTPQPGYLKFHEIRF